MAVRVTVEDLKTGESESAVVPDGEYMILTTGACHVAHVQAWAGGKTVQLTIKDRHPAGEQREGGDERVSVLG